MGFYNDVLDRIANELRVSSDAALAKGLGVHRQAIYNWRHRTKFDVDEIIEVCKKLSLDIDYILTGKRVNGELLELIKLKARYEELSLRFDKLVVQKK